MKKINKMTDIDDQWVSDWEWFHWWIATGSSRFSWNKCHKTSLLFIDVVVLLLVCLSNCQHYWLCSLWHVTVYNVYLKESSVLYECEVIGPPQTLCLYGGNGGMLAVYLSVCGVLYCSVIFVCLHNCFFTCVSYAEARNRYRLDVRPSVRPSLCHTLALYENGSTYCHDFFTAR